MKTIRRHIRGRVKREKGSALLVSLMVMVGLSLLGLGFVAVTETESVIAVNERNSAQALAAAEIGARAVVEWFQDPVWCQALGILPENRSEFKTVRKFPDAGKNGVYRPNAGELLFDKPFRGNHTNRFYGDGDLEPPTADVWIHLTGDPSNRMDVFLGRLNASLFKEDRAHGESTRISDIRVYAPPMPGAEQKDGFWVDDVAARYGVATIKVTAEKLARGRVVAQRHVKAVIAETPFPTVDGAIQTTGTLVGQGNFKVFWGKVLSEKGIQLARPAVGMPWFDAKNHMMYEYGYDSAWPWKANEDYKVGDAIMAPLTAQEARPELKKFSYIATNAGNSQATPPADADWVIDPDLTFTDPAGITWRAKVARSFPIGAHPLGYHNRDWFYQILRKSLQDPWLHVRARQEVLDQAKKPPCGQPATVPHPCKYNDPAQPLEQLYSNFFQDQTRTDLPNRVEVVFPTMDYEFWKNIAMSGNNENGVYYFRYANDPRNPQDFYGPRGMKKPIYFWLNALTNTLTGKPYNGLGAGFYFFDTANGRNPQFNRGGVLTPDIMITPGNVPDNRFQMQGYIYINARNYGSTGEGRLVQEDVYAMPGEPFRDVGYREVRRSEFGPWPYRVLDADGLETTLPDGNYVTVGQGNGVWDYQDANENGMFDLYLEQRTVTRPDGTPLTTWMPVPFYDGCRIADRKRDGVVVGGCSEPHEPYLNLTYPSLDDSQGASMVEWHDPTITSAADIAKFRKPKFRTGVNSTIECAHDSTDAQCTSNYYDRDGALVRISPLLWGALYNEGGYRGAGNAQYYGALLMRAHFESQGTPEVYFNECLARGCLEDQLRLQRVTVTSWQTE